MEKLNVTRIAIAAGIGAVDEMLERNDAKAVREGTKSWAFMYRVAAVAAGFGLQMFMNKRFGAFGETAAISATPLLVKSIAKIAMAPTAYSPRLAARSFTPRGIGARAPEFDQVRMV
jgi:hypothetical protein